MRRNGISDKRIVLAKYARTVFSLEAAKQAAQARAAEGWAARIDPKSAAARILT
jgi:hypothetical protein